MGRRMRKTRSPAPESGPAGQGPYFLSTVSALASDAARLFDWCLAAGERPAQQQQTLWVDWAVDLRPHTDPAQQQQYTPLGWLLGSHLQIIIITIGSNLCCSGWLTQETVP